MRQVKNQCPKEKLDEVKSSISGITLRAVEVATQRGASIWFIVKAIRDMDFWFKQEWVSIGDTVKPRCDWEVPDTLSACVCGDIDMQTGRICYPLGGGGGWGVWWDSESTI